MNMEYSVLADKVLEEVRAGVCSVKGEDVNKLADAILSARRIICAANGRTGLQIAGFAMRLGHLGLDAHLLGEVTCPPVSKGDLLLLASGSGSSMQMVEYSRTANRVGASKAVLTANAGSILLQDAAAHIVISAPTKFDSFASSIQPMGTQFEQSLGIVLDTAVLLLMNKNNTTEEDLVMRHQNLE